MKVQCIDVDVYIGSSKILEDIEFMVDDKEFVGVIGPNGSGKSTLLRCIYRVLKQKYGSIYVDDKNINDLSVKETAKKMAVVSQHNDYNFDFTVEEIVLMGRTPHKKFMESDHKDDYKIMKEALGQVGMEHLSKRSFTSLSGGEKQRIILARALAQRTDCLILDEPTNHLDIKYQLQFMNIAKQLGITVISAIHDLNIAAMYCDRIYALKNGKIVCEGATREVLSEELIQYLYDVQCSVIKDHVDNSLHILYKPY